MASLFYVRSQAESFKGCHKQSIALQGDKDEAPMTADVQFSVLVVVRGTKNLKQCSINKFFLHSKTKKRIISSRKDMEQMYATIYFFSSFSAKNSL
jgi:hypothetical protein